VSLLKIKMRRARSMGDVLPPSGIHDAVSNGDTSQLLYELAKEEGRSKSRLTGVQKVVKGAVQKTRGSEDGPRVVASGINDWNERGDTPLHVAVQNEDLPMVRVLLSVNGVSVNKKNMRKRPPIHYLLTQGEDNLSCDAKIILESLRRRGAVEDDAYFELPQPNENDLEASRGGNDASATDCGNKGGKSPSTTPTTTSKGGASDTNTPSTGEDEDNRETTDVIDRNFMRKLILVFTLPFVYLIFINGIMFALKFVLVSLFFYFISLGYFVAGVTIRPPWYHHKPGAKQLTLKNCPDYWEGMIHNPRHNLNIDYEDVKFETLDGYVLDAWFVPCTEISMSKHKDFNKNAITRGRVTTQAEKEGTDGESPTTSADGAEIAMDSSTSSKNPRVVTGPSKPVEAPTSGRSGMGLVCIHGGGRDRRAWLRQLPLFQKHGFSSLLFDFREHGLSSGSSKGFTYGMKERHDVVAAVKYMKEVKGFKYVAVVGTSVGGASAIMAGAIDPTIDVIVAENPILTCAQLQDGYLRSLVGGYFSHTRVSNQVFRFFRFCCSNWLNLRVGNKPSKACQAAHVIHKLSPRPVFLLHGTYDTVVPPSHSERLYEKAAEPKELWMCPQADHCCLYNQDPIGFETKLMSFLHRHDPSVEIPTVTSA